MFASATLLTALGLRGSLPRLLLLPLFAGGAGLLATLLLSGLRLLPLAALLLLTGLGLLLAALLLPGLTLLSG